MPQKRWPAPRFAALADRIVEETGARIIVVGYGADQPLARQMRLSMRHGAVDLVGQTTIGQLAALLRRSHLYIGNDFLPLHLAVGVGTPVVGMFGPTDPAINGPYNAVGGGARRPPRLLPAPALLSRPGDGLPRLSLRRADRRRDRLGGGLPAPARGREPEPPAQRLTRA